MSTTGSRPAMSGSLFMRSRERSSMSRLDPRDGTEAPPLDQDGRVVEQLGRLHRLAVGGEQRRIGQPLLDELEAHQPVVERVEGEAGKLDHVHFHAVAGQLVHERADEGLGPRVIVEGAVDQIHPEHPQRLLLARVLPVPHARVDDDLRGRRARLRLEPDAQPALPLLLARIAPRRDGVGEDEEPRRAAARAVQPLQEQRTTRGPASIAAAAC